MKKHACGKAAEVMSRLSNFPTQYSRVMDVPRRLGMTRVRLKSEVHDRMGKQLVTETCRRYVSGLFNERDRAEYVLVPNPSSNNKPAAHCPRGCGVRSHPPIVRISQTKPPAAMFSCPTGALAAEPVPLSDPVVQIRCVHAMLAYRHLCHLPNRFQSERYGMMGTRGRCQIKLSRQGQRCPPGTAPSHV